MKSWNKILPDTGATLLDIMNALLLCGVNSLKRATK